MAIAPIGVVNTDFIRAISRLQTDRRPYIRILTSFAFAELAFSTPSIPDVAPPAAPTAAFISRPWSAPNQLFVPSEPLETVCFQPQLGMELSVSAHSSPELPALSFAQASGLTPCASRSSAPRSACSSKRATCSRSSPRHSGISATRPSFSLRRRRRPRATPPSSHGRSTRTAALSRALHSRTSSRTRSSRRLQPPPVSRPGKSLFSRRSSRPQAPARTSSSQRQATSRLCSWRATPCSRASSASSHSPARWTWRSGSMRSRGRCSPERPGTAMPSSRSPALPTVSPAMSCAWRPITGRCRCSAWATRRRPAPTARAP